MNFDFIFKSVQNQRSAKVPKLVARGMLSLLL